MHLPNRNHKTDDGPVYARRQTPEEIQDMLTPKGSFVDKEGWFHPGPECECRMCVPGPMPITHGEIVAQVKAGSEEWGPREDWVIEPIAEPAPAQGPPHEVADMEAERKFREANEKLVGVSTAYAILDEKGFLKPLAEVQAALNNHEPGAKADNGKLDYTLVPTELEEAVCEILMFGAKKYTRDGWRSVPNAHVRYLAALERHIKAFKRGEDCDPESGLHHLAHAACNLAFLLHFLRNGEDVGSWRFDEEQYNGA